MGREKSGRRTDFQERINKSIQRAIKQADAGIIDGHKSLTLLLQEAMQADVLGFLRAVAPFAPKELLISHEINITETLAAARSRVVDADAWRRESVQALEQAQTDVIEYQADNAEVVDNLLEAVDNSGLSTSE